MRAASSLRNRNWEQHGFGTIREVKDEQQAKAICGLQLQALQDELEPQAQKCRDGISERSARGKALEHALYARFEPINDTVMLALSVTLKILVVLVVAAAAASVVANWATFLLFGWSLLASVLMGLLVTGIAFAAGHILFERLLSRYPALQIGFGVVTFALFIWAVLNFAEARGEMVQIVNSVAETESFVDGALVTPTADATETTTSRSAVEGMLGSGLTKMALAAELIVAILFGLIASIRSQQDFAGWRHLRRLKSEIAVLQEELNRLGAIVMAAQKECAAGILRGRRFALAGPVVPFFKIVPVILLLLANASSSFAQSIKRHEATLIDISRSVGGDNSNSLFREFLVAARQLLETEPPNSRVTIMLIAADSFGGGVPTLLKGHTPGVQGVFDDDLRRARKQLASTFQGRTAELRPTAAATDIVGSMWRAKIAIESEADASLPKTIYVLSDMRETASFNVAALLALGPTRALERVKADGHVVPLQGYRIFVYGATTAGSTPAEYNALKAFWQGYFEVAGAQLVAYSSETTIVR